MKSKVYEYSVISDESLRRDIFQACGRLVSTLELPLFPHGRCVCFRGHFSSFKVPKIF
ncbi:MAG: hypothetical protein ACI92E_002800, partial [Oceanicoccus sp.]